jgi:hypothetical protein
MTEAELERVVLDCATLFGWHYHVDHDSRRATSGWPDLAFWRAPRNVPYQSPSRNVFGSFYYPGGLFLVELKTEKGPMKVSQHRVFPTLRAAGIELHLWRPHHWTDGTIERRLRGQRIDVEALPAPPVARGRRRAGAR